MGTGGLLGLGASVCWAFANVYIQRASSALGPVRALLWSQIAGLLGLGIIIALGGDPRTAALGLHDLGWLALGGVASFAGYLGVFRGFERAPLSFAVPIVSSWSLISALMAIVVFGERLRLSQAAGGFLVVLGVVVVARFASRGESATAAASRPAAPARTWLPSVFAAALGFGVLIPVVDHLAPSWGRLGAIAGVFAADLVLGLPLALALRIRLSAPTRRELGVVVTAGFFETLGFVCISLAGQRAPVALVSPLASLSAPLTVMFAWLWLRERPAREVLVGAALACAGVLALAF